MAELSSMKLASAALLSLLALALTATDQPNIVLILADDVRLHTASCYTVTCDAVPT